MKHSPCLNHAHMHEHHHEVSEKTVLYLFVAFIIKMILSLVEIIGGLIAGSVSLIGDALHNTSDALSILIAVIAFKIGRKKADSTFTYGFKRAEIIGGFVNLILLFISGCYLAIESISRLWHPEPVAGTIIIWISILAVIIDAATAKLSHGHASDNTNMRMVFLHNLSDALGSVGVIVSGLFAVWMHIYWVDALIAMGIAAYMIYQAVASFPHVVRILMNAAPVGLDLAAIQTKLRQIKGVRDVHHMHVWHVNEHDISLECHIIADDMRIGHVAAQKLREQFGINHCNIQIEKCADQCDCCLSH